MSWAERNREGLDKARAYLLDFRDVRPSIFQSFRNGSHPVFPLAAESDRGTAMLLFYAALRQNIGEERLIGFLSHLWQAYGTDMFRLSRLPFSGLQARIKSFGGLRDWPLAPKAAGILRSVCDFFYRHGRLIPWVHKVGDGEACIRTLSEEIFLMGKTSAFKPKPRHFLWLLTQLPGAEPDRIWKGEIQLSPSPGHNRFLREFGPLKNRKSVPWTGPEEKLAFFNAFYRLLFPGRSYLAFAGLEAFLRPEGEGFACRVVMDGCANCALALECPGRDI